MDRYRVDILIDQFEVLLRRGASVFGPLHGHRISGPHEFFGSQVHDWAPVWAKAEAIQAAFRSGVRYPSQEHRDQTWTRFNNLRNEVTHRANLDRERTFSVSKDWRDRIMAKIEQARLGQLVRRIAPVVADNVEQPEEHLRHADRMFSDNKHQMLLEHRDECLERIEEVRVHTNLAGEHVRADAGLVEYHTGIEHILCMIENNISRNRDTKLKALRSVESSESKISRLSELLDRARIDSYRTQIEAWLADAQARKESVEESVWQLNEWIQHDERRRADILAMKG